MTDLEFLTWLKARLINVYGESEFTDFVQRLQRVIDKNVQNPNWGR